MSALAVDDAFAAAAESAMGEMGIDSGADITDEDLAGYDQEDQYGVGLLDEPAAADDTPLSAADDSDGSEPAAADDTPAAAGQTFPVEIGGETYQVPVEDLTANYRLRAEVESQREAAESLFKELQSRAEESRHAVNLVRMIDENPEYALGAIARASNVPWPPAAQAPPVPPPVPPVPPVQQGSPYDPYEPAPAPVPAVAPVAAGGNEDAVARLAGQIAEMNARMEQRDRRMDALAGLERDRRHQAEFAEIAENYPGHGLEFSEVAAHWRNSNAPSLRAAFHDLWAPRAAERAQMAAASAEKRRTAARAAAPMAQSGQAGSRGSAVNGQTPHDPNRPFKHLGSASSVEEALDLALGARVS